MGQVIGSTAKMERIEEHLRVTLRVALARGGEVAEAAQGRLAGAIAAIDVAINYWEAADEAETRAWEAVLIEDVKSDLGIGRVRDAMWNMLGRPRACRALDQVFPGGTVTYTSGDPRRQPVLMQVLRSRLATASAPEWPSEQCQAWAAEIDALRAPFEVAVEAHRPAEAAMMVADVHYRLAVREGQQCLAAYKRDLRSLGLTQEEIHGIIPDAARPPDVA
jgi:hypothetical protein